jgi:hypothetical protein
MTAVQLALPLRGLYRTDPAWLAARDNFRRDMGPDETPAGAFMRAIAAAMRMLEIETSDGRLERVATFLEGGGDAA